MWISRDIEGLVRATTQQRPVVLLTGARQAGKTSLFQRLFPDHRFISLDLPSEAAQAEEDGTAFLARHGEPLVIDEVQYAPGLLRHLKRAVDAKRSLRGRFLLTGSQKFSLMKGISESLAGRAAVLELEPLSSREIRTARPDMTLEEMILRGGYPELHQDPSLDVTGFYRSYIVTYLERDLRSLLEVTSLRDFERFLRACALRTGQLLNKAELARDVGISPSTANQWISVLCALNIVVLLEPWFSNRTRSIIKSPKLYLSDTGILLSLLNVGNLDELRRSPLLGQIWETFVFAELRRRQLARTGTWSIQFFRDRSMEVDFLVDRGGTFDLYEAKWAELPAARDTTSLGAVSRLLGEKNVRRKTIICRAQNPYPIGEGILACGLGDLEEKS